MLQTRYLSRRVLQLSVNSGTLKIRESCRTFEGARRLVWSSVYSKSLSMHKVSSAHNTHEILKLRY